MFYNVHKFGYYIIFLELQILTSLQTQKEKKKRNGAKFHSKFPI